MDRAQLRRRTVASDPSADLGHLPIVLVEQCHLNIEKTGTEAGEEVFVAFGTACVGFDAILRDIFCFCFSVSGGSGAVLNVLDI